MTRDVTLDHLIVKFGEFTAVDDAHLEIEGGEFFSFLGPSGCGKTTILRCVTGFMRPTSGRILIGGEDMAGVGPNKRPTALIFQNLALFPLMSVAENIAFPLEMRGVGKTERRKRADELLDLIALSGQGDKRPSELSGGQRQRVAVARALAVEPDILLLDEPLSALDLKLRQHMRTELRAIQQRVGLTFIYITHDQGEALTMSDRVAVMSAGRIEQVGSPADVYDRPETPFVASFVGENNVVSGAVSEIRDGEIEIDVGGGRKLSGAPIGAQGLSVGDRAMLFIRPEALRFDGEARNQLPVRVANVEFEGNLRHLVLDMGGASSNGGPSDGESLRASQIHDPARTEVDLGAETLISFASSAAVVLPAGALAKD